MKTLISEKCKKCEYEKILSCDYPCSFCSFNPKLEDKFKEKIEQKYQLRIVGNLQDGVNYLANHGVVTFSAKLWKDEIIFETNLSFDEIRTLSFVMAIKTL